MTDKQLIERAVQARDRAYAPYSRFRVGTVLVTKAGVVVGVNVENASFGLTVCSERNAVAAAVALGLEPGGLQTIVIAAEAAAVVPPCGACRQVIAEFAADDARVLLHNVKDGATLELPFWDLLPHAFRRGSMPKP